MTLSKRNQYWYGETQSDLREELARYSRLNAYPIDHFVDCVCACGGRCFEFALDGEAGVAERICAQCELRHTMADGADYLDDAELEAIACLCDQDQFEITAGIHVYRDADDVLSDHVRWFYVGLRCPACGLLGCYGDWKNDYPSCDELLTMM